MNQNEAESVSRLIERLNAGEEQARHGLLGAIYKQLHHLARQRLRGQPADQSMQATDLVNELYLRLQRRRFRYKSKEHLICSATRTMRNILVDRARKRRRQSHDKRVPADDLIDDLESGQLDLIALDEVLLRLEQVDEEAVRIVELRFFGDQTMQEVAHTLDRPLRSVERTWQFARQWLKNELT